MKIRHSLESLDPFLVILPLLPPEELGELQLDLHKFILDGLDLPPDEGQDPETHGKESEDHGVRDLGEHRGSASQEDTEGARRYLGGGRGVQLV